MFAQSYEPFEINAGVYQGFILSPNLFINDLPKNTVCRCIFKYPDDLCFAANRDLSDLISQHNGGGNWLVLFSTSETKRVMFHRNRADPKYTK